MKSPAAMVVCRLTKICMSAAGSALTLTSTMQAFGLPRD